MRVLFVIIMFISACAIPDKENNKGETMPTVTFTIKDAEKLAELPLKCIQNEYPNKLNQTLGDSSEIRSPNELHPAFYGCFDWHSAVHGHWMLVKLVKLFPDIKQKDRIREVLHETISSGNIRKEVQYFNHPTEKSFERTYGWAWLLKLAEELHTWDDTLARELEQNLQPLIELIVKRYKEFLPKLVYPIRVGEHSNTAFGLSFAWDFAKTTEQLDLRLLIEERAKYFFSTDQNCPVNWEPSGFDFLSPCLEEADLMRRVLDKDEFSSWMEAFLPSLASEIFCLEPGEVVDRQDGKLVHLDGLNFSRAWCLYGIAGTQQKYQHLSKLADLHVSYSLPQIIDGSYEGEHWLATFAVYALNERIATVNKSTM